MVEATETTASVSAGTIDLPVELFVPEEATELVVFSHGMGRGLDSDNNRRVAEGLRERGVASLRCEFLTDAELANDENQVDWPLLTGRLLAVTDWVRRTDRLREMDVGYFGVSVGAAPALRAAARRDDVACVVTRGGRIDLAPQAAAEVDVPVLLVVGSDDEPFLSINRRATDRLADCDLHVLDGAGHTDFTDAHLAELSERTADWVEAA